MSEKTQDHARGHERYFGGVSYGKCIVILNRGFGGSGGAVDIGGQYKPEFTFIVITLKNYFAVFKKKP
jgi:hypothetical protein